MRGPSVGEAAPLLGRLEEQSLLTSILDDVATRDQALVIRGEPGIGKSRLLSLCVRTAGERGMAVLSTTGVQSEAHLPFAGLHQLLRPVRDRVSELRDVQRAALDAAFGLADNVAPEHFRIAMAVLELFDVEIARLGHVRLDEGPPSNVGRPLGAAPITKPGPAVSVCTRSLELRLRLPGSGGLFRGGTEPRSSLICS